MPFYRFNSKLPTFLLLNYYRLQITIGTQEEVLNAFQVVTLAVKNITSGITVSGSKPFAAFSGNMCGARHTWESGDYTMVRFDFNSKINYLIDNITADHRLGYEVSVGSIRLYWRSAISDRLEHERNDGNCWRTAVSPKRRRVSDVQRQHFHHSQIELSRTIDSTRSGMANYPLLIVIGFADR